MPDTPREIKEAVDRVMAWFWSGRVRQVIEEEMLFLVNAEAARHADCCVDREELTAERAARERAETEVAKLRDIHRAAERLWKHFDVSPDGYWGLPYNGQSSEGAEAVLDFAETLLLHRVALTTASATPKEEKPKEQP